MWRSNRERIRRGETPNPYHPSNHPMIIVSRYHPLQTMRQIQMKTRNDALVERENDSARVRTRRPWMAFYPADYLGDTGHLSTTEHGAYALLIFNYWMRGY